MHPPGRDRTVALDRERVLVATGDRDHAGQAWRRDLPRAFDELAGLPRRAALPAERWTDARRIATSERPISSYRHVDIPRGKGPRHDRATIFLAVFRVGTALWMRVERPEAL
jgi:hypothetical protein